MKNYKYLVVFYILFILSFFGFLFTSNIILLILSIPCFIGSALWKYEREKDKLEIRTNKIIYLLKIENILTLAAIALLFAMQSFQTLKKEYIFTYYMYVYSCTIVLLFISMFITFKRERLIRKLRK